MFNSLPNSYLTDQNIFLNTKMRGGDGYCLSTSIIDKKKEEIC